MKRRPLTKTHLLPLPAGLVRQQQLRHHMAWSMLLNVVEITYLLASPEEREAVSTARFRQAETALEACFGQMDEGSVTIEAAAREAIEQILAMHDRQLLSVPSHRYLEAHERAVQLVEAGRSAIPDQP